MDGARDSLSIGRRLGLHVVRLRGEDQAVHGVRLGPGILALPVSREGDRLALPFRRDGFAVGRKLAAAAVGIRHEERSAKAKRSIAVLIVGAAVELGGSIGKRRRREHLNLALARNIGGDLEDIHAPAGEHGGGDELRLLAVTGGLALKLDDVLTANLLWRRSSCGLRLSRGYRWGGGLFAAGDGEKRGRGK